MDVTDLIVLFSIVFHLLCCPYTKVEESFNMQAMHDFLEYGYKIVEFDHLQFPGVVPRTFIGSLFIALLSYPFHSMLMVFGFSKIYSQILCRLVLGLISWVSVVNFRSGVSHRFSQRTSQLTMVLIAVQFHLCFYMSRTLPNTFALIFCLHAFGYWLKVNINSNVYGYLKFVAYAIHNIYF
jgi:alpha-1,6-mannosyltransferase